jgi:hypothetical protein
MGQGFSMRGFRQGETSSAALYMFVLAIDIDTLHHVLCSEDVTQDSAHRYMLMMRQFLQL